MTFDLANGDIGHPAQRQTSADKQRWSAQGSISLSLREVIDKKRIKEKFRLEGVRHGELTLELQWISAMGRH